MSAQNTQLGSWQSCNIVTADGTNLKVGDRVLYATASGTTLYVIGTSACVSVDMAAETKVRTGVDGFYAKALSPVPEGVLKAARQGQAVLHKNNLLLLEQPMFALSVAQPAADDASSAPVWRQVSGKACPDVDGAAVCLCGNDVYLFGGQRPDGSLSNDLWRIDLSATASLQRWKIVETESVPAARRDHTMVHVPSKGTKGYLVVFGGWTAGVPHTTPITNDVHVCDLQTGVWFAWGTKGDPDAPAALYGHSATVVGDMMVIIGGSRDTWTKNDNVYTLTFTADGRLKWRQATVRNADEKPESLAHHHSVVVGDRLVVYGGKNQSGAVSARVYSVRLAEEVLQRRLPEDQRIDAQKLREGSCVTCGMVDTENCVIL
eukprot:PhM_4_TR1437/c0_g1_i1/m.12511